MHEIFVNYRTKGGKEVAYQCERVLTARFGRDSVFLARLSIDPGTNAWEALLQEARRSRVLLALIDEEWLDAPDRQRPGRRALDSPQDWVRREIEEALASGALIVPVFVGRKVEQLDPAVCPGRSRSWPSASTPGSNSPAWTRTWPGSATGSCAMYRHSRRWTAAGRKKRPPRPNRTSPSARTTRAVASATSADRWART